MKRFLVEFFLIFVAVGFMFGLILDPIIINKADDHNYLQLIFFSPAVIASMIIAFYHFKKELLKLLTSAEERGSTSEKEKEKMYLMNMTIADMNSAFSEKTLPFGRYRVIKELLAGLVYLCSSFDNKYLFIISLSIGSSQKANFYSNIQLTSCFVYDGRGFTFVPEDKIYEACVED